MQEGRPLQVQTKELITAVTETRGAPPQLTKVASGRGCPVSMGRAERHAGCSKASCQHQDHTPPSGAPLAPSLNADPPLFQLSS